MGGTVRLCRSPSGGQLVASGRIPIQALFAAIEADDEEHGKNESVAEPASNQQS